MSSKELLRLPALQNPLLVKTKTIDGPNYIFRYYDSCIMTRWAANHSGTQPHVLKPKIQHLYQDRDRNTLWWRAVTQNLPLKKVVRTTNARRVRKIFSEVLFQQGYDSMGRPLALEKLPGQIPVRHQPIRGTIEIMVQRGAITQEPADMRRELTVLLLRTLKGMKRMRKDHGKDSKATIESISELLGTAAKSGLLF